MTEQSGSDKPQKVVKIRRVGADLLAGENAHYRVSISKTEDGQVIEDRKELITARVRIEAAYADDTGEPYPINATDKPDDAPSEITHYDLGVTRASGTVKLPNVSIEDFEKVSWTKRAALGGKDPVRLSPGATAKSDIANSILMSSEYDIVPAYSRLGWHLRNDQWLYVHGGGAWTADGASEVRVHGDGVSTFTMANPPEDDAAGESAFTALWDLFEMCPDKFAAVEIGAVFRAAMGRPSGSLTYLAQNQSGKSGHLAFCTQPWAPSCRWDTLPYNAGKENATPTYIEHIHHTFGDMIVGWDDMAPVGSPRDRADYFDRFARSLFNGSSKGRMGIKDHKIVARARLRPRAFGILSAEDVDAVESGMNRTHIVTLTRDDFDENAFAAADENGKPEARSSLLTAFIIWWAARMPAHKYVSQMEGNYSKALKEATGAPGRYLESSADKAVGLSSGLEFAKEKGWVTADRAAELWERGWAGLVNSLKAQVQANEGRSMSDRIFNTLMDGLTTNEAYVMGLGQSKAWTPLSETNNKAALIGWHDDSFLYLLPSAAARFIVSYTKDTSPITITSQAMGEALEGAGHVIGSDERKPDGRTIHRHTVAKKISGKKQNVWKMALPEDAPDDAPQTAKCNGFYGGKPCTEPLLADYDGNGRHISCAPQPAPTPRPSNVPAPRVRPTTGGTIRERVAKALEAAGGDKDQAREALIKSAIPDAMEILDATRASGRYDHTAHPAEPDILKSPGKGKANQVWEARPNWTNEAVPTATEIHILDVNAAYLSATNTHLPIGKLERSVTSSFDPKRSGLYLVTPPTWTRTDLPNPLGNREESGALWLARPTLVLLMDAAKDGLCKEPVIHESWTSGAATDLLKAFREQIRDARAEAIATGDDLMLDYVKAMYSKFISTATKASRFNHQLERTDWTQIIRAQAHGNLWRRARKAQAAGLTVYSIKGTDELHVTDGWEAVFAEGRALNQMKTKGSYLVGGQIKMGV